MTESLNPSNALPGFNVLLMGPAGTGKTHSLGTLVDSGLDCFYLGLEPGLESLLGYWKDRGLPVPENLHWHMLQAPKAGFAEMIDSATKVNMLSLDALAKMQDPNKSKHNQFIALLTALNDFPDDRTGQKFGGVDSWDNTRVLMVDGMSGINRCALSLVTGGKPVRSQSDWGIAQTQIENLLRMLTEQCICHFVCLAHVERETDAILGGIKLMVSTLGKALAPKIPSMFSDVILAVRSVDKWTWDTASAMADIKTRNLSWAANQEPSFGPIVAKWRSRGTGV